MRNDDRRRTRKYNQRKTTNVADRENGGASIINGRQRRRTWTGRRSGGVVEGYCYRSNIAGIGQDASLSAEDDHGSGRGDEGEP